MNAAQLVAHRGWRKHYPENTLSGIAAAIEIGARNVEIDIQLSADGVPVLFHDRTLRRLCARKGEVFHYPAQQLLSFTVSEAKRLGSHATDTTICSLQQVVELLRQHPGVTLYAEIKAESIERFGRVAVLEAVCAVLQPIKRRVILLSFDLPVLQIARERRWRRLAPVLPRWRERLSPDLLALQAECVFCSNHMVPARASLRDLPYPVVIYEVGSPRHAREWLRRGAQKVETYCVGELLEAGRGESAA